MIISIPKSVRRLYLMIMFVALSYLLYYVMSILQGWINPINNYGIPEGSAVRAFHNDHRSSDEMNPEERLRFYYWYGE
ncbi:DUF4227 family protein [Paenibacillus sp. BR2-3]|uniref:DUF4227 family protein n=1 Tax=Paenibacillus sp. BR2-3 TaxID=3048494 RepID=UPI0039774A05